MVKGVFFDFWGTLVENGTYSPLRQTYKFLRARMPFGKFAEEFEQVFMTKPYDDQQEAFTAVCEHFNVEPKPFLLERLIGTWNKNRLLAKAYPDTLDTLKKLKEQGLTVAIVSNAPKDTVEAVAERFDMTEYLDDIFVSANEGKLKTTGLFDIALNKLKLTNNDVVMVGDSIETDIKGAEAAGIKPILIDRRNKREHPNKIKDLTELFDKLEE